MSQWEIVGLSSQCGGVVVSVDKDLIGSTS